MLHEQIETLTRLPQFADEVWQGGLFTLPVRMRGESGEPEQLSLAIWQIAPRGPLSQPHLSSLQDASPDQVLQAFVQFAHEGPPRPHRPARVEVAEATLAELLRDRLTGTGVAVTLRDELPDLESTVAGLVRHLKEVRAPVTSLLGRGVTVERLRGFAEAAATFHEAAPWRHLMDVDLIRIETPSSPRGMKYATVLGAAGMTCGLSFYGKQEDCWDVMRDHEEAFARRAEGAWSILYGPRSETPIEDIALWAQHDLPVANDKAYPCIACFKPSGEIRRPTAKQLNYAEGLLRALAASGEADFDAGRWTISVATSEDEVAYTLSLPDVLKPPAARIWTERGLPFERRSMEASMVQGQRLVDDRGASSIEEINALLQRELSGPPDKTKHLRGRTPLEEAQDLCFEAFECAGRQQLQFARRALELCPDCADAYVILAERSSDALEAVALYEKGVAAGERALGREFFEECEGEFWGILETRPYMRARLGLASSLEAIGEHERALEHYQALLRLNSRDNQGVHYRFVSLLLELGRDAEAAEYLHEHDDRSAYLAFVRAMISYRAEGDTAAARRELAKAVQANPYVIPRIICGDDLPDLPGLPQWQEQLNHAEAIACADDLRQVVIETPGAAEWLVQHARPRTAKQRPTGKRRPRKRR